MDETTTVDNGPIVNIYKKTKVNNLYYRVIH